MRRSAVRAGLGAILLLVVAWAGACESGTDPAGSDGENGTGSDTGSIVATVTADGSPASAVTVELFAESGSTVLATETTNTAGEATFSQLAAGAYEVEVTPPTGFEVASGSSSRQAVDVMDGQTSDVAFALTATDGGNVVEINLTTSLTFSPANPTIEPGTTVRWINDASIFHTITPDGHTEWERQTLSSAGETFEHTFMDEGSYPYFCEPHESQGMTGTITVQAP